MDQACFEVWLGGIGSMTAEQRRLGLRTLALAEGIDLALCTPSDGAAIVVSATSGRTPSGSAQCPDDAVAAEHKVNLTVCPHCASRQFQRWGSSHGLPRYRCTVCRRSFNALTGTPFAHLRKKEHWPALAQAVVTGDSLVKVAEQCGVAVSTLSRWRRRFLMAEARGKPVQPNGTVEADTALVLESFKGRRKGGPRPVRKRRGM